MVRRSSVDEECQDSEWWWVEAPNPHWIWTASSAMDSVVTWVLWLGTAQILLSKFVKSHCRPSGKYDLILQVSLLYSLCFCSPKTTSQIYHVGWRQKAGKAVGEEEQHCTCAFQQMQLLFLCPLRPSFSCAKGPAHWLCLPWDLASCELKGTWSPGTFWGLLCLSFSPDVIAMPYGI